MGSLEKPMKSPLKSPFFPIPIHEASGAGGAAPRHVGGHGALPPAPGGRAGLQEVLGVSPAGLKIIGKC